MSLFGKGVGHALGGSWPAFLVGAGVVIIFPKLVSKGLRPVAKAGVRGFMNARDKVSQWAQEVDESWREVAAEAEAESATTTAKGGGAATATMPRDTGVHGVARSVMREMINLRKKAAETASEVSAEWSELVAEAKAERQHAASAEEASEPEEASAEADVGEVTADETPRPKSSRTRKSSRKSGSQRRGRPSENA